MIILGDGRNNYHASRSWVLRAIRQRARHVYWLNPEPAHTWDTGDSIISEYGRYCDRMVECRNLRQLKQFVEATRLAPDGTARARIDAAEREVTVDDVPVVLVHGFASSYERNWREPGWADLLRDEGRQVIGVDLLGHGQAARPSGPAAYARSSSRSSPRCRRTGRWMPWASAWALSSCSAPPPSRPTGSGGSCWAAPATTSSPAPIPSPSARAVETGQADEAAGPVAAALTHFAMAPGNDRAALAACLRRPALSADRGRGGRDTVRVLVVLGERDFAGPRPGWSPRCPTSGSCPAAHRPLRDARRTSASSRPHSISCAVTIRRMRIPENGE